MTPEEIRKKLNIKSLKTIYSWKANEHWDDVVKKFSPIQLVTDMQSGLYAEIQKAINDQKLTDPKVADALYKVSAVMEKLVPQKVMLANIMAMLEYQSNWIKKNCSPKFALEWAKNLPEMADQMRAFYGTD
jgi:hypothetical protein